MKTTPIRLSLREYVDGILQNNTVVLSKAITLIESQHKDDKVIATQLIEEILPFTGKTTRIAISGSPGAGKSSLIEVLGNFLIEKKEKKVAVLAIDPSSQNTKGSILGDKTRMQMLSKNKNAYVRPSPAGQLLGGVAAHTRETILLCEAAGYDIVLIETVGVGQSETKARSMVDFFLVLILAGAGDELQGIKRGIIEVADLLAITKSDGKNIEHALQAKKAYENALHLYSLPESNWSCPVCTCSALSHEGIDVIWNYVEQYKILTSKNGFWNKNRQIQQIAWLHEIIDSQLKIDFLENTQINQLLPLIEQEVVNGVKSPLEAGFYLLQKFLKNKI